MKKIVIVNSSPRVGGNCGILCDEFGRVACMTEGNEVTRVDLRDEDFDYYREEEPQDGFAALAEKLMESDVIVLATPVYFYNMSGQLKVFMDRLLPYFSRIQDKDFYFILTAATPRSTMDPAVESMKGFTDSLPGAQVKDVIFGHNLAKKGDVLTHPAIREVLEIAANL